MLEKRGWYSTCRVRLIQFGAEMAALLYRFAFFEVLFFVYSYSHATLVDHGGVLVSHFPVCRPLAGSVAAPSPPKPSAYPPALFPLPPGIEPRV